MAWLVELPDVNGKPFLLNLDGGPLCAMPVSDSASAITTGLGPIGIGLSYSDLCARLRLNPADRMPVVAPPLPDDAPHAAAMQQLRALGRLPAKRDARVPHLAAIASLPAAPERYTAFVEAVPSWILGENDRIGDCTCVGPANAILALTTLASMCKRVSDADILQFYSQVSGWLASDPSTDRGAMIEDVLAAWHAKGIAGDKLDGYATIAPSDHERIKQAIAFLGPVDLGLDLPNGWLTAGVWDVSTAGAGAAGGHCVTAVGYTPEGLQIVSWGQVFTLTWAGWDAAVEEAHALLSRDALTKAGRDPAGVDWTALEGFMSVIREAA